MSQTARVLTLLSKAIVSVSARLSVAAVLGLAALPLLPQDATSRIAAATPRGGRSPDRSRATPSRFRSPRTQPADPAFQLAARRVRGPSRRGTKSPEPPPAHKTSAISPAPVERGGGGERQEERVCRQSRAGKGADTPAGRQARGGTGRAAEAAGLVRGRDHRRLAGVREAAGADRRRGRDFATRPA